MTTIFSKASGQVSIFEDPTLPGSISLKMDGWGGFAGFKSIITRVSVAAQGNYNFLHTLGGQVYVYSFGDRIGTLGISGLSFVSTCNSATGPIGIEFIMGYYFRNRIAARATPIRVTLGVGTTMQGYLIGFNGDVADPKARIYQFGLQFALVPFA